MPERAIVPRLSISSCRSMPMPLSITDSVLAFLSGMIEIFGGAPSAIRSGAGDRLVAQLVAGIRRIRDQFAQEDIGLRIDRMHHQMQEFGNLGLKRLGFGRCVAHRHAFARQIEKGKTSI